jgi:hypothetical protein
MNRIAEEAEKDRSTAASFMRSAPSSESTGADAIAAPQIAETLDLAAIVLDLSA